jgi:hypothetical protein
MSMAETRLSLASIGCVCAALMSCSGAPEAAKITGLAQPGSASNAANAPCETRAVNTVDVAGILVAPITASRPVSGDDQSCEFLTAGFAAITVSVRPGVGQAALDSWLTGKMPLKVTPLEGVGDAAVWQETLHELIAQKKGTLCDIQVHGAAEDVALTFQTLPQVVGALCNKIFAGG